MAYLGQRRSISGVMAKFKAHCLHESPSRTNMHQRKAAHQPTGETKKSEGELQIAQDQTFFTSMVGRIYKSSGF